MRLIGMAALAVVVAFLVCGAFLLPPQGSPGDAPMDGYFIMNAQAETGANNVVTAVLFDYRAYDTLGEATVLFAAALSVAMVFKGGLKL